MFSRVSYELSGGIARIGMDDGKANLMTKDMLGELAEAFRRATADGAVVLLTGRAATFSAGYDMALFDQPLDEIAATLQAGGDLIEQMLTHAFPIVAACNGHAIAQGAFTLLACDVRVGVTGPAKIGLNEVAIGLTIPHYGVEVARHQLVPTWFDHATLTGTLYDSAAAQVAGFLHEVVEPSHLESVAVARAESLLALDMAAHAGTKQRVRRLVVEAIRATHPPRVRSRAELIGSRPPGSDARGVEH